MTIEAVRESGFAASSRTWLVLADVGRHPRAEPFGDERADHQATQRLVQARRDAPDHLARRPLASGS